MTDYLLVATAGLAVLFTAAAALRAALTERTWHGPWLHMCPTSQLLEVVADRTRDKALAAALRDRAHQFAAHGD